MSLGREIELEQPIFTTRAHVFQIDPATKKNWVPASKQAVTVSYFYDSTRNSYRIISVDGAKNSNVVTGERAQLAATVATSTEVLSNAITTPSHDVVPSYFPRALV
ncbi:UNVERIFIED_CONTAM: hypothetical protein K2H54_018701 [Gekko kuhli]